MGNHEENAFIDNVIYHTYSDASNIEGSCAYSFIVVMHDGGNREVIAQDTGKVNTEDTNTSELVAMLCALRVTPVGEHVVVHSDLSDIERIMNGEVSYWEKFKPTVKVLRQEAEDRKVKFVYDGKNKRSHHYAECHRNAKREARLMKSGKEVDPEGNESSYLPAQDSWMSKEKLIKLIERMGIGVFHLTVNSSSGHMDRYLCHTGHKTEEDWKEDVKVASRVTSSDPGNAGASGWAIHVLWETVLENLQHMGYFDIRELVLDEYNLGVKAQNVRFFKNPVNVDDPDFVDPADVYIKVKER